MNKLQHEQNTHGTTEAQDGTDFYARITPWHILARHPLKTGKHDLFASAMSLVGEMHRKFELVELVNALLFDIEASERRAAEADRAAREDCILILDGLMNDATAKGQHERAAIIGTCAHVYLQHSITKHGNISEDREALACGNLPPGGASE